ncbi:MAG: dihydroorotase [Elusimicrobiota bacterium]
MKILLKGGQLIDPETASLSRADILISGGKIKKIEKNIIENCKTINLKGMYVTPGLIDLHTHLREPGREDVETIESGTRAAAKGGFTTICAMPNTNPTIDSVSGIKYVLATSAQDGCVRVLPVGAITKQLRGEKLTEIGKMHKAGSIAISDDGKTVMNSLVMRRAMEYCKMFNLPIFSHTEDLNLSLEGMINEGRISTSMGLRGIPSQAEEIIVSRDIALAELTGCRLHLCHISAERSVSMISEAKRRSLPVTAEVTPHHLTLTPEDLRGYNTNGKMKPPLRKEKDRQALIKGLKDGTIDCVATDHAPHLSVEKDSEFALAPFGITGLETAFPVLYTELVKKKIMSITELVQKMTAKPAAILQNPGLGRLKTGLDADITVIDTKKEITLNEKFFRSKSINSPYIGKKLSGIPTLTISQGKIAYKDEEIFN